MKNYILTFFKISLMLLVCSTVINGTWAAAKPEMIKITDVPYGTAGIIDLTLDLYFPVTSAKKLPLAVWIHGGGWMKGSKDKCPIKWLLKEGYAVASISYRLTDVAIFPAQIHDCKGAIRWLRANADSLGIDPDRIAVFGYSAGGQLATLLATSSNDQYVEGTTGGNSGVSSAVQAVVDIAGATDFILRSKTQPENTENIARRYFGGSLKETKHKAQKASSAFYIGKDDPPVIILHGADDKIVPVSQSVSFHEKYQKAGLKSKIIIVSGAGHNDLNLLFSESNRKTVVDFLGKAFAGFNEGKPEKRNQGTLNSVNIRNKKNILKIIPQIRSQADKLPIPAEFRQSVEVRQFIPRQHYRKGKRIIKDEDAESGYTAPVHNPDHPFSFGFIQNDSGPRKQSDLPALAPDSKACWKKTGKGIFTQYRVIADNDITPGKYKVYQLGEVTVTPDCQIWFSDKSWQTRIQLGSRLYNPGMDNKWTAYASLKFDGPAYGGEKNRKNRVFCDKVILVKHLLKDQKINNK